MIIYKRSIFPLPPEMLSLLLVDVANHLIKADAHLYNLRNVKTMSRSWYVTNL